MHERPVPEMIQERNQCFDDLLTDQQTVHVDVKYSGNHFTWSFLGIQNVALGLVAQQCRLFESNPEVILSLFEEWWYHPSEESLPAVFDPDRLCMGMIETQDAGAYRPPIYHPRDK
jgi:hypothetical protein